MATWIMHPGRDHTTPSVQSTSQSIRVDRLFLEASIDIAKANP